MNWWVFATEGNCVCVLEYVWVYVYVCECVYVYIHKRHFGVREGVNANHTIFFST